MMDCEREAATLLGWNSEIWDKGLCPNSGYTYWYQLTSKQRVAAMVLGYYQNAWNDEVDTERGFPKKKV